jgi:hypothetical protein
MDLGSMRTELSFLWTARTTPSLTLMPMAEVPHWKGLGVAGSYLDGLHGILDLEETAFGGEGVDSSIVFVPGIRGRGRIYLLENMKRGRFELDLLII